MPVLSPGPNELGGFILTTALGIAGAFVATFIGQTIGWYRLDQGAGLIGATVGLPPRVIFGALLGLLAYKAFKGDDGEPSRQTRSRKTRTLRHAGGYKETGWSDAEAAQDARCNVWPNS